MARSESGHDWTFFRAGDFDQVSLTTGADLMALDKLDQKLWAALACPVKGLHFDAKTLELIDTDGDGRIRAPELIAAIKWAGGLLRSPDELLGEHESLPLGAINDSSTDGATMLSSIRHVLVLLGKPEATEISIADTVEAAGRFAQLTFNGDGIITADAAAGDEALRSVVDDIIACLGADTDLSGKPGLSRERLDRFLTEAAAFSALARRADEDKSILPLGDRTAAAAAAIAAVRTKVTDYFTRCRLAEFDSRATNTLNRDEKDYLALSAVELTPSAAEIAALPLSHVEAGRPLALTEGINPAWEAAIERLRADAIVALLGDRKALTLDDWQKMLARIAPFETWNGAMSASVLHALPVDRVRKILGSDAGERLAGLIGQDLVEKGAADEIHAVDRLVRYCRHLRLLCENFVNFRHFYSGESSAIFQVGRLYIDQRCCDLTLLADDAARQATMAGMAGAYLLYCDCARKSTGERQQIVAAVTNGDGDNLMVGRNGIFYDRAGRDWDATITKIIENPISVRQAFWAPYKKLVRLIEEQVAKRAAAAEATSSTKVESVATTAANADKAKPPEGKKFDVGTVAAMGVAFGALMTAFAAIAGYASGLFKLPFWQLCLALVVLLLIISGPSVLIAWLKLRKRNLGPILDANGWAVNAKARINVPFGASLTGIAQLPRGARITAGDRFSQRPVAWPKFVMLIVIAGFFYSLLNYYGFIEVLSGGMFGTSAGSQPGVEDLIAPAGESPPP